MGVQTPLVFSPDGARVAFVSDVYPECADEACNARRAEEAEKNPVKVHHVKRLLYPSLVRVARGHRGITSSSPRSRAARRVDSRPATSTRRRTSTRTAAIAFSPDGKQIAFVSNRDGNDVEAWTTNHDVWIVPVTGGAAQKLTPQQGGGRAAGVDARRTADRRAQPAARRASSPIAGISTSTTSRAAQQRTVFETPDLSVEDFTLAPDGRIDPLHRAGPRRRQPLFRRLSGGHAARRRARAARSRRSRPARTSSSFAQEHADRRRRTSSASALTGDARDSSSRARTTRG